jgi:DNA adenine methylase
MDLTINSPFRYAGGKFYARKLIIEHIPPHTHYVEPFAGGASIFFAKPKSPHNWLNDLDDNLVNVYQVIRDQPYALVHALKGEVATKERHTYYKRDFQPANQLEEAQRWYYLNRTSYSGIMNMKNCFWGYGDKYSMRPENWGRNILRTSVKLQGVCLTRLDFEEVIQQAADGAFLFIDPPYFNADQDKFYNHPFSTEQHDHLCKLLKKHRRRLKFLLTYDNSSEIVEMYQWADAILEKEWNYTINRTDDQTKEGKLKRNGKVNGERGSRYKGREVFIMNYPAQVVQPQSILRATVWRAATQCESLCPFAEDQTTPKNKCEV